MLAQLVAERAPSARVALVQSAVNYLGNALGVARSAVNAFGAGLGIGAVILGGVILYAFAATRR